MRLNPKITFHDLREDYTNRCIAEQVMQYLEEKLVVVGKGAKYGQVIFLAGGAGSGKGFAIKNYLEGDKFKVFDPDAFKDAFVKMAENLKNPEMIEFCQKNPDFCRRNNIPPKVSAKVEDILKVITKLNLRNPGDVGTMHMFLKGIGLEGKRIAYFFSSAARASWGKEGAGSGTIDASTLPNVLFDNTLKDSEFLVGENGRGGIIDTLMKIGYKKENFHIVWVLTDVNIAIDQNFTRDRVVPTSILFQTHRGAATNMQNLIFKSYGSLGINGDIAVILGGKNVLVQKAGDKWHDSKTGKTYKLERDLAAKIPMEWDYFRVKRQGSMSVDQAALEKIRTKIMELAPKPTDTPELSQAASVERLRQKGKFGKDVAGFMGLAPDVRDVEYKKQAGGDGVTPLSKFLSKLGVTPPSDPTRRLKGGLSPKGDKPKRKK